MKTVRLPASDGFELGGTLHGDPKRARAGVLIAPAMGVAQRYYADFAAWLAAQGYLVLSFDYRGMGASRPAAHARSLRGFQSDIVTWAEQDAAGAVAWLRAQLPADRPLHWIGHSLGGQIYGLLPNADLVDRVVTVAAGSGYWRDNARPLRRYVWWLWHVIVPVALKTAGYFPGRRLRMVGDLPHGVMAQWRRWCLSPDYLLSEGGSERRNRYAQVRVPILALSFTDDEFMSARNIDALHACYRAAPRTPVRVSPAEIGVRRIGHFGFFRPQFEPTLWTRLAQWLRPASPSFQTPSALETA